MATAKPNKKVASVAVELPECPVCMETLTIPIYQCQGGHSLCNGCNSILSPPICPICRQLMTQMRNYPLEDIISKAKVPCPNKSSGCVYTMLSRDVEDHLKECIFREMECPVGVVFGRCSWSGKLKEMMEHFKARHIEHCNVSSDTDVELDNIDVNNDDRFVYLTTQGKLHFIITMKIDSLQKMAYWTVQLIGGKHMAQQHIYEIHVTSKQDNRRKVVFIEHCFSDAIKADEVFRQNKCAVVPLDMLKHFIKDKSMSFRFFIKRVTPPNKKGEGEFKKNNNPSKKDFDNNGPGTGPKKFQGPNKAKAAQNAGPGPKGPKAPGAKNHYKA